MVRVLHCFGSLNRGGIQSFVMNIYRMMDRSKVQFDFLLVNSTGKDDLYDEVVSMGGRVFSVCPRTRNPIRNRIELARFFREHKEYSILHYHMSSCSYSAPIEMAHKYHYQKIIMHAHSTKQTGNPIHTIIHKLHQKKCIRLSNYQFACSDKAGRWLYGEGNSCQIRFIRNGIHSDQYTFNKKIRAEVRNEWVKDDSTVVVGHVGRFVQPKNHEKLIDIFDAYIKKNANAVLVLVGDGELLSKCKEKVAARNLEDKVFFLGSRSDVSRLLQGFDIFVMPSLFEGFPVTLIEAQAAGLPCVVSDTVTRQAKILKEVEYVNLDGDISVWAETIATLVQTEDRRDTRSAIIEAGYDSKAVAEELQALYLTE